MKLGKKTKTKLPACQHRDTAMNMNGQEMPEVFKIVWIEAIGFHPHIHCEDCNVTAKNAVPAKYAMKIRGYESDETLPPDVKRCENCGELFDLDFFGSPRVCEVCDDEVVECDNCEKLTEQAYEECQHCGHNRYK